MELIKKASSQAIVTNYETYRHEHQTWHSNVDTDSNFINVSDRIVVSDTRHVSSMWSSGAA